MTNPIEAAVAPLKADAIARATKEAEIRVENARAELLTANNDLNVAAPYPHNDCYHTRALNKYAFYRKIATSRAPSYRSGEPRYADIDPVRVARYVKECGNIAASQYDLFIAKLVSKIGDTTEAVLNGNHVWSCSFLIVVKPDGVKEVWKTQQIVNVSANGKIFPQWPSRKIKR